MTLRFKRGDTVTMDVADTDNNLVGATVEAAVMLGSFYEALTVSNFDDAAGTYTLSATAAATAKWPIGSLDCDIKYTFSAGDIDHTNTFQIQINNRVTR